MARPVLIGTLLICMQVRANSNVSISSSAGMESKVDGNIVLSPGWRGKAEGDTIQAEEWRQQAIRSLTDRLETEHFAPRTIDDAYSADVWNKFINDLDKNKEIFLADDLRSLGQYKTSIDDEMHAHSTRFFDAAVSLFHQRIGEVMKLYHSFLAKPVRSSSNRTVLESRKGAAWPKDAAERKGVWEDRLRLMVLKNMVEAKVTKDDRKAVAAAAEKTAKSLDVVYKFNSSPEGCDQQFSIYLNEMTGCMDPHSAYFSPVDARTMNEEMSHLYYGVGIELTGKDGEISVKKLMPGGSALKSGLLRAGDQIISVGDKDDQLIAVAGMPMEVVARMLRGEKGTTVRLQISRPGEGSRIVTLARAEMQKADAGARAAIIERDGRKTGYIYLPMFYVDMQNPQGAHSSADVKKLLLQLKDSGITGLVMDLRNNPGGSLDEVMNMAALFIDHGPLVQLKDKYSIKGMAKNPGPAALYDGPMTVLVNGRSASASEIFAAAMQDYRRAIILGSPTFGKGTAQENVAMGKVADRIRNRPAVSYGAIRLSIEKFYRINGGSTQLKGVEPDVLLPDGQDYLTEREKDMPFAMHWDEINPLPFEAYPSWDTVLLQHAAARVNQDTAFSMIRENVKWLDDHRNTPYHLEFKTLRAEIDALNDHLAQITKASNMAPDNGVRVREQSPSSESGEGTGEWSGQLKKDIYIREAMNILNEMNKK